MLKTRRWSLAAAGLVLPSAALAQSITTNAPNNGVTGAGAGVFMDLTGIGAVDVGRIDTYSSAAAGTAVTFNIYTRAGTYVGFDTDAGAWTLSHTINTSSNGTTTPLSLNLVPPIPVAPGATVGVYVTAANGGIRYTTGTSSIPSTYSNAEVTLFSSLARTALFGGTGNTPRVFAGTVFYNPSDPSATGACCLADGTCQVSTLGDCGTAGGVFQGQSAVCANADCAGACCFRDGTCSFVRQSVCASWNGTFQGQGTPCGPCVALAPELYSNGNITTGPTTLNGTAAPAGTVWSEVAKDETLPTVANTISGYNTNFTAAQVFHIADDFTVPAGGWNVQYLKVPIYQTGSGAVPTITSLRVRLYGGPPNAGGTPIFGDETTNRLAGVEFARIYRTFSTVIAPTCGGATTPPDHTRPVMFAYATINQQLAPGTYWVGISATGTVASGPWVMPTTEADAIGRQASANPNALGRSSGVWTPLTDAGQGCTPVAVPQDLGFRLLGTPIGGGSTCYANCDSSTAIPFLNVADFTCFLQKFAANDPYANCDESTNIPTLNVADFTCFLQKFAAACSAP